MKRFFPILLAVALLCGCTATPVATIPAETSPTLEVTLPESDGLYDPESALERSTNGAVQVFPLDADNYISIRPMGDSIVAVQGGTTSTLTKFSGETLIPTVIRELDTRISFEDPSVQVSSKGVTYYDDQTQELVFLDTSLKEVSRFALPADILGEPILSADRKSLYYCTSEALRVMDLELNLDRLIKEMSLPYQSPVGLHCGDTILECNTQNSAGQWARLFISTGSGLTICEAQGDLELATTRSTYFAVNSDGAFPEMLYGAVGQQPLALSCSSIHFDAVPLLERDGVILITQSDERTIVLDHYDLSTGKRTATLSLPETAGPSSFYAQEDVIYFVGYDEQTGADAIYRWSPAGTPTGDETSYFTTRRSYDAPDEEGLARCAEVAAEISQRHGVEVLLWQDAVATVPSEYTLEAEYQVPLILDCLEQLGLALGSYPTGFLKQAAIGTQSGTLRICLVRGIYGSSSLGSLDSVNGLQFWDSNEDAYVCLVADTDLSPQLYHELFHVIDSRVLSTCSAYDDWEALNPAGFEYDYDYLLNQSRTALTLVGTAFVDGYSMSFPKEDRASIMEYAMMAGNEALFASPVLQSKLQQLCQGIRQAFKLELSQQTYLWEQYLTE